MFGIEEEKISSSQYFLRKIQTSFSLIILPPTILALITYFYHDRFRPEETEISSFISYLTLAIVLGLMFWSYQILFRALKVIKPESELSLRARLVIYYQTVSQQLGLLSLVLWGLSLAYVVTFAPYFCYLFIAVIIFTSLEWPTKHKMARHLRLKKVERDIIINQTPID